MEASRNVLSALVIVHGHFLATVSPQGSFMAWSMESAERTGLCSHMDPFITNPIYWHLKLLFREIFDRLAVWSDRGFLHSCVILFMLSNNQEVVPLSPLNSGKSSWVLATGNQMGPLLRPKHVMVGVSEFLFYFVFFLDTWGSCAVEGSSQDVRAGQ